MAEIVQIALEANRRSMIENRRWEGALIIGPAVLAPLQDVAFTNSAFDAAPEAIFLEIPDDRFIIGVIGLRNVTFNDCEFRNIGIVGTTESVAKFRAGMIGGGDQGVSSTEVPPSEVPSTSSG